MVYTHSMIRKSAQFQKAEALRKRGFTYGEIARIVAVSKSTVSLWFGGRAWSKAVAVENTERAARENKKRLALLNKARGNQYKKLYAEAERSATTEFKHYRTNPLFVAGLMLYISEGDTVHPHRIRITTSNAEIHRIFLRFATEFFGIPPEKIRFWVLLYPDHNPLAVSRHWSKAIELPLSQFHKYQVIENKSKKHTLQYGVGNTIIDGAVLKRKLIKWIELIGAELR